MKPSKPLYIKVHETDNVAIVVNSGGLPAGAVFDDGLTLREHVPQGHKVALTDLAQDAAIIRYGEVIGYAEKPISQGAWVDESLVRLPEAPPLDASPMPAGAPAMPDMLEGFTFQGYRNADGSVGTRNLLGITTSV